MGFFRDLRDEWAQNQREYEERLRQQRAAHETLLGLDELRRRKLAVSRSEWKTAQRHLDGRYSRQNAYGSSAIARKRIEYLMVPEPDPARHEFLPKGQLTKSMLEDAVAILAGVDQRYQSERAARVMREEQRLAAIKDAEKLFEAALNGEKRERLVQQAYLWPTDVQLDPEIVCIDGLANQIRAQNCKLDQAARNLETILSDGLNALSGLPSNSNFPESERDPDPRAVESALKAALDSIPLRIQYQPEVKIAYSAESRQAIIEFDFPDVQVVPQVKSYKHLRDRNAISHVDRPASQVKALYSGALAQLSLLVIATAFRSDRREQVDTVAFNGYVRTIDPRRGQMTRPCLVTVRVSRNVFTELHLREVDPKACLKHLAASVSNSPADLAPVKPIVDLAMVDPRFISPVAVIAELDSRSNLLELSPTEFEGLIQNLFEKMGLEAKQTQASRDGGVDCIAYDNRPIFGGKVVIQAKRYKNTVGVSAVRDLYGTLQNEGASKGILVTTSGYGAASFEFATNKPIELLDGPNLLYLLKEHAGIDARIEAPTGWHDPVPDSV